MSDIEVSRVFARLRAEVEARPATRDAPAYRSCEPPRLGVTAERFASVTGDLPYMHRPGTLGRVRGLLVPVKFVLRKLMRWYVEPIAVHQREFNAAVLVRSTN
jgi:hypothetical protein